MNYDYTLYLVTDRSHRSTAVLKEAVTQAIIGGCTMIQLRESSISDYDYFELAKEIKKITDHYGVPLIINNRIDIALSVCAAGVHVGQKDIPACVCKRMIKKNMLLGVSASTLQEALQAQKDGADYLGVGAMFPSATKPDARIVPKNELMRIRQAVPLPIVVIGGINRENAAEFGEMGVDGLAVISAILSQPDIQSAARELKDRFKTVRKIE